MGYNSDYQARLDRYMERQGGRDVATSEVMFLFFDIVEAHDQLQRWVDRHPEDCEVLSTSPLTVRVYPTVFRDPEQKGQRDLWKTRRVRR